MPETSPQNKQILKKLLAEPGNKHCADCKTGTHPRWTSWNIGIFLCIRCSGVHRSLGTHISKVRSVDLDSWSDAQLVELQRWGNAKANQYWEAGLPGNHIPDESKIVNFIRTKYDLKRWVAQEKPQPESLSAVSNEDVPLQQVKDRRLRRGTPATATSAPAPAPREQSANLLDFDSFESAPPVPGKGQPTLQASGQQTATSASSSTNISRTPSLGGSRTSPDIFSAPPSRYTQSRPTRTTPAAPAPVPSPAPAPSSAAAPRADLKKSILSLYAQKPQPASRPSAPTAPSVSTTSSSTSAPASTSGPQSSATSSTFDFDLFAPTSSSKSTATTTTPASTNPTSSLIDSLGGLSFGSSPAPGPAPAAPAAPARSTVTQPQTVNSTFAPVEEDDFFANPWK